MTEPHEPDRGPPENGPNERGPTDADLTDAEASDVGRRGRRSRTRLFLPVIASLLAIVLLWPSVCLISKRLHDLGLSGWLQLIYYALAFAIGIFIATKTFGLSMSVAMEHQGDPAGAQAAKSLSLAGSHGPGFTS